MIHVVFDLDETLGHFSQLSEIVNNLARNRAGKPIELATKLLHGEMRPFIRPGILELLRELNWYRNRDLCKTVIYTNNDGGASWVDSIVGALSYILRAPVFDEVIYAYNVSPRTTQEKTYGDLRALANVRPADHVIFIDDVHHPGMNVRGVTYIKVSPYVRTMSRSVVAQKLERHGISRGFSTSVLESRKPVDSAEYESHGRVLRDLVMGEVYRALRGG